MPHESFRSLQTVHEGWWSALVELTVNYSLAQHRVAFHRWHCVPYPGGCHPGHLPRPRFPFSYTTTPTLTLSPLGILSYGDTSSSSRSLPVWLVPKSDVQETAFGLAVWAAVPQLSAAL